MKLQNRNQYLDIVRISRQATVRMGEVLSQHPLDLNEIQTCIEHGAIIEEVPNFLSEGNLREDSVVEFALLRDNLELLKMLSEAEGLDGKEDMSSWARMATENGASKCLEWLISIDKVPTDQESHIQMMRQSLNDACPDNVSLILNLGLPANTILFDKFKGNITFLHETYDPLSVRLLVGAGCPPDYLDGRGLPAICLALSNIPSGSKLIERKQRMVETVYALLDVGSPLITSSWSIYEDVINQKKLDEDILFPLIKKLADKDIKEVRRPKVKSVLSALALWEAGVYTDIKELENKISWRHISYDRNTPSQLERLFEKGILPPDITQINFEYIKDWMEVGVFCSPENKRHLLDMVERESGEVYPNGSKIVDNLLNDELVAKSNSLAEGRLLYRNTVPAKSQTRSLQRL